jgi:hypothetical protein
MVPAILVCMRRSSKKLPKDPNQLAAEIVRLSTEEPKQTESVKSYLAAIGRKGGLKGGKARRDRLTPSERKAIAKKAAKARWAKKRV